MLSCYECKRAVIWNETAAFILDHAVLLMASVILWLGDPYPEFGGGCYSPTELCDLSLVSVLMRTEPVSSLNRLVSETLFFTA